MNATELEYDDYVLSLGLGDMPRESRALDGAVLYRINPEHVVILGCLRHVHRGPIVLRRYVPRGWVQFATFQNDDDAFRADHWGPVDAH